MMTKPRPLIALVNSAAPLSVSRFPDTGISTVVASLVKRQRLS